MDFPGGAVVKNPSNAGLIPANAGFDPWVKKFPWSRKWQSAPVFLPGKSNGQESHRVGHKWMTKHTAIFYI